MNREILTLETAQKLARYDKAIKTLKERIDWIDKYISKNLHNHHFEVVGLIAEKGRYEEILKILEGVNEN